MKNEIDFSDIAPYRDEDVASILQILLDENELIEILKGRFPRIDMDEMKRALSSVDSILAFQDTVMRPATAYFVEKTIDKFTIRGLEKLDPDLCYLFISNHWDIALDSALLGWSLFCERRCTPQIAIGDNLFMNPWLAHLFKLNKTVIVARSLSRRALYESSLRLSQYISQVITTGTDSFWIAQSEGRTKDGNDCTQSGLVKMLSLAGGKDPLNHLKALNPVPVSISYEFDPCDLFKARERFVRWRTGTYVKGEKEDLNSIIRGLEGYKGRVHIEVGDPIVPGTGISEKSRSDILEAFRQEVDHRIMAGFHLWPSHYLASDLLDGTKTWQHKYNRREKEHFQDRLKAKLSGTPDEEEVTKRVLELYANPLKNKILHGRDRGEDLV